MFFAKYRYLQHTFTIINKMPYQRMKPALKQLMK